ncbi:NADPH-dependent FMN reductase [Nocardia jiangxiensis]|uniref:NADPH-dependent FMN reductase n=1 Tax=Nocardia jiangxiensis TaxID=282685 RepID=UPI00068828C3|nr:NAD(P)H-dependent oxidoreductase [Nocardia jiangxiensis]
MRTVVVVGNPRPQSRTRLVAELVADKVATAFGAEHDLTVDLCDYAADLFRWPDENLSSLSARVAQADLLVVASPTYKGAYTGMLKSFLDRYPSGGLAGVTAIPVMTGADALHSLTLNFTLCPLLIELGATVPMQGLYFQISQMNAAHSVVDKWAAENLNRAFWRGRPSVPD